MNNIIETIIAKCCEKIFSWLEPRWTAEVEAVKLVCPESGDLIHNSQLREEAYWPALAHNGEIILIKRDEPLVYTQAMAIASEHLHSVKFPLPMRKKTLAYAKDGWERIAIIKNYRAITQMLPERSDCWNYNVNNYGDDIQRLWFVEVKSLGDRGFARYCVFYQKTNLAVLPSASNIHALHQSVHPDMNRLLGVCFSVQCGYYCSAPFVERVLEGYAQKTGFIHSNWSSPYPARLCTDSTTSVFRIRRFSVRLSSKEKRPDSI